MSAVDQQPRAATREIDAHLRRLMSRERGVPPRLRDAMRHSLFGGGKRLRPLLVTGAEAALRRGRGVPHDAVLDAACAFELVHTYSLVHDDLPAMDDDILRRGRPTCHVAFDEATAILAGDGLLTYAFAVIAGIPRHGARLAVLLAEAAGPAGMVGGQQLDLEATGAEPEPAVIRRIHLGKTARLIAAPLEAGAILAGADAATSAAVRKAGLELGLAFQALDDQLDAVGSAAQLGKTPGKDARQGKASWANLEGADGAGRRAARHGRRGAALLAGILPEREASRHLLALADRLWRRDR
jgi:geranylgeranyl pyrophosphate synthase